MKKVILLIACLETWSVAQFEDPQHYYHFENDFLTGTDRHYTNGLRYTFARPVPEPTAEDAPRWGRWLARKLPFSGEENAENPFSMTKARGMGNLMYTPRELSDPNIDPNDRPYGGWLYYVEMFQATRSLPREERHSFELQLGWTGEPSLSEFFQKTIHEIIDDEKPLGWDNQIKFEPGVVLLYTYERRLWTLPINAGAGRLMDFNFHGGGSLGNIFTYAHAGLSMRFGWNLPFEFGLPAIRPSVAEALPTTTWEAFVFAIAEGRAVGHNIFLEGGFRSSPHSVEAETWVGELDYGFTVRYKKWRFVYTILNRTKEFELQDERSSYGSLAVIYSRGF